MIREYVFPTLGTPPSKIENVTSVPSATMAPYTSKNALGVQSSKTWCTLCCRKTTAIVADGTKSFSRSVVQPLMWAAFGMPSVAMAQNPSGVQWFSRCWSAFATAIGDDGTPSVRKENLQSHTCTLSTEELDCHRYRWHTRETLFIIFSLLRASTSYVSFPRTHRVAVSPNYPQVAPKVGTLGCSLFGG